MPDLKPVTMRGVRIIFRNFRGEAGKFNQEGTRNFGVILPPEVAEAMANDGWNVKLLQPREEDKEEGELPVPWLPVEAAFSKGRPPQCVMITERGRTDLSEETVQRLDYVDIVNVDMIVNPSTYDVNGRQGVKAYLKSIYVTIEEDELEREYAERFEAREQAE
jgi:hypothetical protein